MLVEMNDFFNFPTLTIGPSLAWFFKILTHTFQNLAHFFQIKKPLGLAQNQI